MPRDEEIFREKPRTVYEAQRMFAEWAKREAERIERRKMLLAVGGIIVGGVAVIALLSYLAGR